MHLKEDAGSQNWQPGASVLLLSAYFQETHLFDEQLGQVRLALSQLTELLDQCVPATETPRSSLRTAHPAQGPLIFEVLRIIFKSIIGQSSIKKKAHKN